MRLDREQRIANIREVYNESLRQLEIAESIRQSERERKTPRLNSGDSIGAATATPNGTPTF